MNTIPANVPKTDDRWRIINELMKQHEDSINRIINHHRQSIVDNGFKGNLRALVEVGFALAYECLNKEGLTQDDIEQIIEQHCNQSSREAHSNAAKQIFKLITTK